TCALPICQSRLVLRCSYKAPFTVYPTPERSAVKSSDGRTTGTVRTRFAFCRIAYNSTYAAAVPGGHTTDPADTRDRAATACTSGPAGMGENSHLCWDRGSFRHCWQYRYGIHQASDCQEITAEIHGS